MRLDNDSRFRGEIVLETGQHIRLSDAIVLEVVEVIAPGRIMVLDGLEEGRVHLTKPEYQLGGDPLRIDGTPVEAALWCSGETWMRRVGGQRQPLVAGKGWMVSGTELRASLVDAETASTPGTASPKKVAPASAAEGPQLTIHPTLTVVQFPGEKAINITGRSAQILYVTACFSQSQGAVGWEDICRQIWPKVYTRGNWDQRKNYLRRKLAEAKIRDTFFVYEGGQVWLDLQGPEQVTIVL